MNTIDILSIIFISSVVVVIIIGASYVRYNEKKNWNNGYCKECGNPWIHFDTDSQGGRMYKCNNGHYCDISYRVDK